MRKTIFIFCISLITCCWCSFALSTQAQESDPQKLLLDSIDKLDVSGARTALDKGANPNWVSDPRPEYGASVIYHLARTHSWSKDEKAEEKSVEILLMLFKAGAKLQKRDQNILYWPIDNGWEVFTKVLLENGANPTKPIDRETPMEVAFANDRTNIINLLKKYGAPELERSVAAQITLIEATWKGQIAEMEKAIQNGAHVNGRNSRGETALTRAVRYRVYSSTYRGIEYLLKKGANPNVEGMYLGKAAALHIMMNSSSYAFKVSPEFANEQVKGEQTYSKLTIESLLRHGAYVSARDNLGRTPLHVAAEYNNIVGAKMLIEAGAKIMPRDDKGKTPLDYAESAEMIKLLKAYGAKEE